MTMIFTRITCLSSQRVATVVDLDMNIEKDYPKQYYHQEYCHTKRKGTNYYQIVKSITKFTQEREYYRTYRHLSIEKAEYFVIY